MYIDPDDVINKDNLKQIESSAVCSICSGIVIEPVQCLLCENSFCKNCLEDWKKKKGENSCPFRCSNPSFKNSRLIKNLLANLKFKCQNGCNLEIPYLDLQEHYKEKCSNIKIDKIDYKAKYLEYKQKYEDLLEKYEELESKSNSNRLRGRPGDNNTTPNPNQNQNQNEDLKNGCKSKFHSHYLKNSSDIEGDWICNLCKSEYSENTEERFQCSECDFDACLKCILLERTGYIFKYIFLSKYHEHLLEDSTFEDDNWICYICKKSFAKKSDKRFRCEKCDFDLCNNCKNKEEGISDN